jgi:hypothetical protein
MTIIGRRDISNNVIITKISPGFFVRITIGGGFPRYFDDTRQKVAVTKEK